MHFGGNIAWVQKKMATNRPFEISGEPKKANRLSLKRSSEEISGGKVCENGVINSDNYLVKSQMAACKSKDKRKANWTTLETKTLVNQVMDNYDVINANHSGSKRVESHKKKIWGDIVDLVNRLVACWFLVRICECRSKLP